MFKLIKKIPLECDSICIFNNNYLLLKDNIIFFYDFEFNKIKQIKLEHEFQFITCDSEFIYLANELELYKYDFQKLSKLDIGLDITNITFLDNIGLLIISNDKVFLYNNELKEFLKICCSNLFKINNKIYYVKENAIYDLKNEIQKFDFKIKDCIYDNNLILLSDNIYIYKIETCDKFFKLLKCLNNCKYSIPISVACIEKSLANILNEEANKIKKIVCSSDNICDLLKVNESVNQTIKNIILLEQILCTKLEIYYEKSKF